RPAGQEDRRPVLRGVPRPRRAARQAAGRRNEGTLAEAGREAEAAAGKSGGGREARGIHPPRVRVCEVGIANAAAGRMYLRAARGCFRLSAAGLLQMVPDGPRLHVRPGRRSIEVEVQPLAAVFGEVVDQEIDADLL